MIRTLSLEVLDERAGRPRGNPFMVRSVGERVVLDVSGNALIRTGLKVVVPDDLELKARPVIPGLAVLNVWFPVVELMLFNLASSVTEIEPGAEVAVVEVVEKNLVPIRFMEVQENKRVITGEARSVESCPNIRNTGTGDEVSVLDSQEQSDS